MDWKTLEDEFGDVVGKARRGQEMTPDDLAARAGISTATLAAIERYETIPDSQVVRRLADALGLDAAKLQGSAQETFFPAAPCGTDHGVLIVQMLNLGQSVNVNGYVIGCRQTGAGAVIDPGADADSLMQAVNRAGLRIDQILMTHGHQDHTGALAAIRAATGAPARIHPADLAAQKGLQDLVDGEIAADETITVGGQRLLVRSIPGHTAGCICLIHAQAAFVGDILFAGSLGGTRSQERYFGQIDGVSRYLLSLEDHVVLYPGHGPATTVGEEKANNPFFR